jgi:hypothetical protein
MSKNAGFTILKDRFPAVIRLNTGAAIEGTIFTDLDSSSTSFH